MVPSPPTGESARGAPTDDLTTVKVREALDGNRQSLDWVVSRLSPLLRVQAAHRMGPDLALRVEPDDVVAEAWLVTLRRLGDLAEGKARATPRLLAFLGETIVRTINGHLHRTIRRGEVTPPVAMEAFGEEMTGAVTRAVRMESQSAVAECLRRLPEKDRTVVVLRGIEGLSNDEAAEELGELPTTVSHRYRRALAKLRNALPDSIFGELLDD